MYDCIVLTQTLHLIFDFAAAVRTCYRILKPGGTLLLTVRMSQIANDQWQKYWMWSFTRASTTRILAAAFGEDRIAVETHGNVLAATAFLYGTGSYRTDKNEIGCE